MFESGDPSTLRIGTTIRWDKPPLVGIALGLASRGLLSGGVSDAGKQVDPRRLQGLALSFEVILGDESGSPAM